MRAGPRLPRFAVAEPGLYRTAFCRAPARSPVPAAPSAAPEAPAGGSAEGGAPDGSRSAPPLGPHLLLVRALDALVACGRMPARRRPGAELTAWATMHGLVVLVLDGPLAQLAPEQTEVVAERAVETLLSGFTSP